MLVTGCAAGRPWPAQPVAVAARNFANQGEISTIDVLPLDLHLWADPDYNGDLDELRAMTEVNLMNVALDAFAKRDYALGALIDWNGNYDRGTALSADDLVATVGSLSRYGATAAEQPGALPVPFLPARLGTATGADATLYVGGWAYVGTRRETTGEQIAKGVVIGLLILTVVAVVALAASKSKSSKTKGDKSRGDWGRHARSAGQVASGGGGRGPVRVLSAGRGAHRSGSFRRAASATADMVDAFGHAAVHIALNTPDWGENPALPPSGGESQMYLEMTLVDNRTGLTLWHARQTFPASAASASETARVARTMLSMLPARAAPRTAAQ